MLQIACCLLLLEQFRRHVPSTERSRGIGNPAWDPLKKTSHRLKDCGLHISNIRETQATDSSCDDQQIHWLLGSGGVKLPLPVLSILTVSGNQHDISGLIGMLLDYTARVAWVVRGGRRDEGNRGVDLQNDLAYGYYHLSEYQSGDQSTTHTISRYITNAWVNLLCRLLFISYLAVSYTNRIPPAPEETARAANARKSSRYCDFVFWRVRKCTQVALPTTAHAYKTNVVF